MRSGSTISQKWIGFNAEINHILADHRMRAIGLPDDNLLTLHRNMLNALLDAIGRQRRELALLAGEKVEPVAYEASAVVRPLSGLGGG
jgi:hypothetical protein